MKKLLSSLVVVAVALFGSGLAPSCLADPGAAKGTGKYQIVFHVSENSPQQWQIALNNAMSFQRNLGKDNTQVEIVANGPGLNMLKLDSPVADRVTHALDLSIDVVACGETMKNTKITGADLIGGVRVVLGGIIEIADRQRAGWTYIRP
ncbi:MAG: DsrE family protein [Betaproteobacteria bacterium]|nr:DsrE family protein [Betaproteobacteria bacterium]